MPYTDNPHAHRLTPDYWGYDIFDTDLFINAPRTPYMSLSTPEYRRAYAHLRDAMGEVAVGNCTEIRYGIGNEFNTDLPDGSLVVIGRETLTRSVAHEPGGTAADFTRVRNRSTVPITRPYSQYWRDNQDGAERSRKIGSEAVSFPEKSNISFLRRLDWGILVTRQRIRAIQPFMFQWPRLINGKIELPHSPIPDSVVALPVTLGETRVHQRLPLLRHSLDCLDRIKSIDVVYTAAGNRQVATGQAERRGRLACWRLGTNPA